MTTSSRRVARVRIRPNRAIARNHRQLLLLLLLLLLPWLINLANTREERAIAVLRIGFN
jgi:hypothetical protein